MRNRTKRKLLVIVCLIFFILFILLLIYSIKLTLAGETSLVSYAGIAFSAFTFLFGFRGFISIKVIKPGKYQIDSYFVDRDMECGTLVQFIKKSKRAKKVDYRIFRITGVTGIGKTLLLRELADRINRKIKPSIKIRRISAYYIKFDNNKSILENAKSTLGLRCDNNSRSFSQHLQKASYKQTTLLLIDNLDSISMREANEFALAICQNSKKIIIVLAITTSESLKPGVMPGLFFDNEIRLLESKCKYIIDNETREEILHSSKGIPAYIRFLCNINSQEGVHYFSNKEEISDYIYSKVSNLSIESKELLTIILNRKYIDDSPVKSQELLAISGTASQCHIKELAEASLIYWNPNNSSCDIENFIYEICIAKYSGVRRDICTKIYRFYKDYHTNNLIAMTALLLSGVTVDNVQSMEDLLKEQYSKERYYFFIKLGNSERNYYLNPDFKKHTDTYDLYRYYYLSSLLQLGRYPDAYEAFRVYDISPYPLPALRDAVHTEFEFSMQYLIADLNHLSNHFDESINYITILMDKAQTPIHKFKCQYLIAHCLKHIGADLERADGLLQVLAKEKIPQSLLVQVLYSQISIHLFWGDTSFDYSNYFQQIENLKKQSKELELAYEGAMRHKANYLFKIENDPIEALQVLLDATEVLEKAQQRRIYDFYFEIAEMKRILNHLEFSNEENKNIEAYYDKAIVFAEDVKDYNLYSCAELGKILLQFENNKYDISWKNSSIQLIVGIINNTRKYDLRINESYAQAILCYIKNEPVPYEQITYFEQMCYNDIRLAAKVYNDGDGFLLKLTVM